MATTDLVERDSELKPYLNINPTDDDKDELLDQVNDYARHLIEAYLGRLLVTRGAITEYHSIWRVSPNLYALQRPIISVTTIHEDAAAEYGASTLLTVTTDYVVSKPQGKIIRVDTNLQTSWTTGFRAIKMIYTAGYANTAAVPSDIKFAALRTCGLIWSEVSGKQHGLASISDDMGNISRFAPAGLTEPIQRMLPRLVLQAPTGEVDA